VLWVFFTDKGIIDAGSFAAALSRVADHVPAAAQARRARETGGKFVPDLYDLPVDPGYVAAVARTGVTVRHVSRWLNAMTVIANESEARAIAQLPYVRILTPARQSRKIAPYSTGSLPPGGGIGGGTGGSQGQAPQAPSMQQEGQVYSQVLPKPLDTNYGASTTPLNDIHSIAANDSGWTGASVVVAMFDSGFDKNHPALSPLNKIAEYDFVFGDTETANQANDNPGAWDHGTGTWSVLGGYMPGSLMGAAFNSRFLLAKTEDIRSETPVEEDNWVAAVEWGDSLGCEVISSSLAYLQFDNSADDYTWANLDGRTTVVTLGAVLAQRRGIMVCNAMGNEGPGGRSLWAPADADSILSCGAVSNGAGYVIANFSSRGNTEDGRIKPEVVAQGVNTPWAIAGTTSTGTASGTSLSTPLIGGAAALVREAHPEWTVGQVRQALMTTADRAATPDSVYGWGRINVTAAIYNSSLGPPVAPKPFNILVPVNGGSVTQTPVTFRWRKANDPQGGTITYSIDLHCIPGGACACDTCYYRGAATTDTTQIFTGYLGPSRTYEWFVTATDPEGHQRVSQDRFRFTTSPTTGVGTPEGPASPPRVALFQSYPNPARSSGTHISYSLTGPTGAVPLTLRIYDAQGRLVRSLLNTYQTVPSQCSTNWNGQDENGRPSASGIYYYRLEVAGTKYSKRLVLVR